MICKKPKPFFFYKSFQNSNEILVTEISYSRPDESVRVGCHRRLTLGDDSDSCFLYGVEADQCRPVRWPYLRIHVKIVSIFLEWRKPEGRHREKEHFRSSFNGCRFAPRIFVSPLRSPI
jgi:hypothetical protein